MSLISTLCVPVPLYIDPHLSDQWAAQCRWPLSESAKLHLCPLHQIGVPANTNAECWPHDSDTQRPQRYWSHCDKTGEPLKHNTLFMFCCLFSFSSSKKAWTFWTLIPNILEEFFLDTSFLSLGNLWLFYAVTFYLKNHYKIENLLKLKVPVFLWYVHC